MFNLVANILYGIYLKLFFRKLFRIINIFCNPLTMFGPGEGVSLSLPICTIGVEAMPIRM